MLSRHADLLAAFHSPALIAGRRDLATVSFESEEAARLKMREETRDVLCPAHVRAWRGELAVNAERLCEQLPVGDPVDLIAAYGRPLCLLFAARVTRITYEAAVNLEELAQNASAATAAPEDGALRESAKAASQTLRQYFPSGPEPLRDSGFVGLSQTLLRIVSSVWYALIQSPEQWSLLRRSPESIDQAMEELLRYAGAIRILLRTAIEDVDLNGAAIRKGDQIILRIFAGNHDPQRFSEPQRLDCARRDPGHFTLGSGGHACVAANLIRTAAIAMSEPLLTRFASVALSRPVEWRGGSILRNPAALWVAIRPHLIRYPLPAAGGIIPLSKRKIIKRQARPPENLGRTRRCDSASCLRT